MQSSVDNKGRFERVQLAAHFPILKKKKSYLKILCVSEKADLDGSLLPHTHLHCIHKRTCWTCSKYHLYISEGKSEKFGPVHEVIGKVVLY
jgi:hypothetical protein